MTAIKPRTLSCAGAACDHLPRAKRRLDFISRAKRAHARGVPLRSSPGKVPKRHGGGGAAPRRLSHSEALLFTLDLSQVTQ